MKLSPKDKPEADNMAREISESTQQASVLFYIMKLHGQEKLIQYGKQSVDQSTSIIASNYDKRTNLYEDGKKDLNNNLVPSTTASSTRSSIFPLLASSFSSPSSIQTQKVQHNKQTAL